MTALRKGRLSLLLTCEHGGNSIPAQYQHLFDNDSARAALASHRGWDPGSLPLARRLQRCFDAPLISSRTSRLLIELNRSIGHPQLFSEWSIQLTHAEQQRLIDRYYHPYRQKVVAAIAAAHAKRECVLHISVHTFTPVWNDQPRTTGIGLLFDPRRKEESAFCISWQRHLQRSLPNLRIHRNRPYRGTSDGLTTALRSHYAPSRYWGIELELNQGLFRDDRWSPGESLHGIVQSLQCVLGQA
ncbi:MAG: N-formylglutamate amidohydrolase [Planctomycetaceae bacterium]|nr:N-formylglutamate amidohydrolase [Planctomycetaceae bacterium]